MKRLLVVSIAETLSLNQYSVISYDFSGNIFYDFDNISSSDLWERTTDGPIWDLFGETTCDVIPVNKKLKPRNPIKFLQYWPMSCVLGLFRKNAVSIDTFLSKHLPWAFINLDKIKNIEFKEESARLKSYITFEDSNAKLLVKDFRWLHYWSSVDDAKRDAKVRYWISFCNATSRSLFAVCCRHTFENGTQNYWIAGLHPFPL